VTEVPVVVSVLVDSAPAVEIGVAISVVVVRFGVAVAVAIVVIVVADGAKVVAVVLSAVSLREVAEAVVTGGVANVILLAVVDFIVVASKTVVLSRVSVGVAEAVAAVVV